MCGICGWVITDSLSRPQIDRDVLRRMRDEMRTRGPDDAGEYFDTDGRVGLAHRRLSIVDLSSAGKQPMSDARHRVQLVFNGEIYNHLDLRKDLELSFRYSSSSDTETILYSYIKHGVECIEHLDGDFAVAIWDATANRLLLARDRLGVKPLYYWYKSPHLLFASELKALLVNPLIARQLNPDAVANYLVFEATDSHATLVEDVRKLPPGCMLSLQGNGVLQISRYWDPATHFVSREPNYEAETREVSALFHKSVFKRMMADVPVGVSLSGGVDSTAITAIAAEHAGYEVYSFSLVYAPESDNSPDPVFAREAAAQYGTKHHEVRVSIDDFKEHLDRLVIQLDDLIGALNSFANYMIAKAAHECGLKVLLVGEGSDEIFFGYPGHLSLFETFSERESSRSTAYASHSAMAPHQIGWVLDLQRNPARRDPYHAMEEHEVKHFVRTAQNATFDSWMVFADLSRQLANRTLMRVDKTHMAWSVEARVPFMDHRLVEYCLATSAATRTFGNPKQLLRDAVAAFVPRSILNRRKHGLRIPVRSWFLSPWGEAAFRDVLGGSFFRNEIRDKTVVEQQWRSREDLRPFWRLFLLAKWYEHFIAGH